MKLKGFLESMKIIPLKLRSRSKSRMRRIQVTKTFSLKKTKVKRIQACSLHVIISLSTKKINFILKNLKINGNLNFYSFLSIGSIFIQEDKKSGRISFSVAKRFIKGTGGCCALTIVIILSITALPPYFFITLNEKSWGSAYFPSDASKPSVNNKTAFRYILYSVLTLAITTFIKSLYIKLSIVQIGRELHSRMVFKVLHSSVVNFLQRTPLGVILNRFSNDINNVDTGFSLVYINITYYFFGLIAAAVILLFGITSVMVLIPLILYLVTASYLSNVYMKARREVSRLSLSSKSPVVGLPTSCIEGAPLIRSLHLEDYFADLMSERIEENSKNLVLETGLGFWFDYRAMLAQYFVLQLPLYIIMGYNVYNFKTDDSAALVNFLFSVLDFAPSYLFLLKQRQTIEINALSFERCFAYEDLDIEPGYSLEASQKESNHTINNKKDKEEKNRSRLIYEVLNPGNRKEALKRIKEHSKHDLFHKGAVEFKNVSAWYPTSETRSINQMNLVIPGGQKVGIVGRSGGGKSTFLKLLWRAMEPRIGTITIDGQCIQEQGLKEYREQLNIILQKPNIFKGTLASNISSKELSDEERDQISSKMMDLGFPASKLADGRLGYEIDYSGNNLSLSEKQVICLVQSLMKKSRIVVMDEATAFVDPAMEEKFNQMIWSTFQDSTMFVIAHRIKSVLGCDWILVFEKGSVIEDGVPEELLKDEKSVFYEMWKKGQ